MADLPRRAFFQKLIGQGGAAPLVNDYTHFDAEEEGPHFVIAEELHGSNTPGTPAYKVLRYLAAQSGKRGDSLYPLNIVIQRNAGDPKSDQIGLEINVNNNGEPLVRNEPHWLTGFIVASGGETHPGVGAHIGSTTPANAFITGLKIEASKEISLDVTQSEDGQGIVLRRNNDTHYKGSAIRFLAANGDELWSVDYDGSGWCRGTKVWG